MFWKERPLNEEIELKNLNVKVTDEYKFKVFDKNTEVNRLLFFINEQYNFINDKFCLNYTLSSLEYFLKTGFWVGLFKKDKDVLLGVVACRKVKLNGMLKEDYMEVNFLCVHKSFRKDNLAPHLIDYIINMCTRLGYYNGFFTRMKDINNSYFCKKKTYLKVLNEDNLKKIGFLNNDFTTFKDYSFSQKPFQVLRSDSISYKQVNEMENHHKIYRQETYQNEKCFVDFVLLHKGEPCAFFRYQKMFIKNKKTEDKANQAILYEFKVNHAYINPSIMKIMLSQTFSCLKEKGIDFCVIYEPLKDIDYSHFIKSSNILYHYFFNSKVKTGEPDSIDLNPI